MRSPAVMNTAGELPGLPRGVGLTGVSWAAEGRLQLSPSLIGVVADLTDLRVTLPSVVLAGLVVLLLGRILVSSSAHAVR